MKHFLAMTAFSLAVSSSAFSADLKTGDAAPQFKVSTQASQPFDLKSRQGQWTVLYFYPKASTPGCTKQACAFRDNIKKIRAQGAEVYGISSDSVADQEKFHKEQHLNFDLLADEDGSVSKLYGTKMFGLNISKRWTFIIDPNLKIADIARDVDPIVDSQKVADQIEALKKAK